MGRWKAFWAKHDPDDLFSYDTFKMVTIRDRYLGMLHHGLQIGKEFLNRDPAIGLVRLAVQNPPRNLNSISNVPHSYCTNPNETGTLPRCVYPPIDQVSSSTGSILFLTTHMNVTDYYSNCDVNLPDCEPVPVNETKEYLVANLDHITISIDHSAQVDFDNKPPLGYLQTLKNPEAEALAWKNCKDCSQEKFLSLSSDKISLKDMLQAAHLDLESIANDYLQEEEDYTGPQNFRTFGAVILLSVVYDNVQNYFGGSHPILYYYRPQLITDIDDYSIDSIYTSYPNNRTLVHRKGIRIVGVMAGEIGSFTFQALLIQLTTSIALVKVATTAVDLLAIYLLPRRVLYKNAKYEKTDDFGDIKKSKSMQEMDVRASEQSPTEEAPEQSQNV